jgi:tetratricopeptide (TPR) repeat protein
MSSQASPPVSGLLQQHQEGVRDASAELVALVAAEIRRIAGMQGRAGDAPRDADERLANLLATVLSDCALDPQDRPPFLTIYARAVRQVVCDHLSEHGNEILGSGENDGAPQRDSILSIDAVLHPIERVNARLVTVVECLYFARLTEDETAAALRSDRAAVQREWTRARAWVIKELGAQDGYTPRSEVSVPNAVWVDAVLRSAIALPVDDRDEFLARCHAAAPNLRQEVEDLLRLGTPDTPGPRVGDLSADALWSVLTAAGAFSPPVDHPGETPPAETSEEVAETLEIAADPEPVRPPEEPLHLGEWRIITEQQAREAGRVFLVRRAERDEPAFARMLAVQPTSSNIQLFNHECGRLAAIDDPAVARLLDHGISSDGHFYVVHACARGRALTRYCERKGLGLRSRVELLVRVCAGLQAAHRMLVAHGGLGDSTVVVGDDGKVVIRDCGVAPMISALAGTHAAPSAASVSSDIKQAGLLLRTVVFPSTTSMDGGDADLAAISRCAAGDHSRERYSSIGALRSDLQRWLDRRPVLARGGGRGYRVGRFITRRRVPVAVAATLALVATVLLPPRIAERQRTAADRDRGAAIDRVLAGLFDGSRSEDGTLETPGARLYVARAATLVRSGFHGDPGRRSAGLLTVGRAYLDLGAYQSSIDVLEEALALARQHHGDDSVQVAEILEPVGQGCHALGRYGEAESALRTARAIRVLRAGAAHPSTRSADVELARLLHQLGRTAEAEQILRTTVAAPRSVADSGSTPDHLAIRSRAALAGVLSSRGQLEEAERLYRDVLAASQHRASVERAGAQVGLAGLLIARRDTEEAATLLLEGLQILRRHHGPDHPVQLEALRTQARLRLAQSQLDEARAVLSTAGRIHEQSVGAFTVDVPATRALQAELALREGRMGDAVAASRLALEEFERLSLGDHPLTIEVRAVLGEGLTALGRRDESGPVLERALAAAERAFPPGDPRTVRLRAAVIEAAAGRRRQAPASLLPDLDVFALHEPHACAVLIVAELDPNPVPLLFEHADAGARRQGAQRRPGCVRQQEHGGVFEDHPTVET